MSASRARALRCLLGAAALALMTGELRAEPTVVERETARTLLLSGREKRRGGQLREALSDFEKAHAIMRVPTTGLDLGKAQRDLGLLVEARASFLEAAHYPERPNEASAFTRARREAKQLADEIAPRLATLELSVSAGAQVKIDDAELSVSSLGIPLKVNPGRHEIVASAGDDERRTSIELREGESRAIDLRLASAPQPAPSSSTAPDPPAPERPATTTTTTSSLVWIGLGVAGVGAVTGATTGLLSFGMKRDVESRCYERVRCPPSTYEAIDRGQALGTISTIAFLAAGVGAAVMIYGLLHPTRAATGAQTTAPGSSARARLEWVPDPSGVRGAF